MSRIPKKELLMSFDEYNKTEHPIPYTYILGGKNQLLYYFGSRHCYDPLDQEFDSIDKFWDEFIKKTDNHKRIVLLEGGNRAALATKEVAILEGGEMHYVAYLAKQANIFTFSPEPPERFRFEELLKHFSKEEIIYYEFARVCHQWNTMKVKPDFYTYMNKYMKAGARESGWNDFEFTIENLIRIHKKLFGIEFDKNDKEFFYNVINPTTEMSVINKVSRFEDVGFRDNYILGEIGRFWNENNSIFVIYGASHAVMHEPVLRDFIAN